jgi:hypothetical protein
MRLDGKVALVTGGTRGMHTLPAPSEAARWLLIERQSVILATLNMFGADRDLPAVRRSC